MGAFPSAAAQMKLPEDNGEGIQRMVQMMSMLRQQKAQDALLPGQVQQQQQALASGAMENQQKQIQLKDQQAMTNAMQEWDGKDINTLPGLMLKHGASAQTVMSTKTGIIKQQQDLANLSKDQLANEKTKNDYFAQQIENVKGLPPEQQPQAFEAAKADAIQKGHLDPQAAQQMQYQGPEQLDMMEKSLLGHSGALETALKGAQTTEAANRAQESNATAEKTNLETEQIKQFGGLTPAAAEARYRSLQQKLNMKQPVSPEDQAWMQAYRQTAQVKPQAQVNVQTAGAAGANGQPSELANMVAGGQLKWSEAVSPRWPMASKIAFAQQVKAINPSYKSSDFDVEKKVQEAFTSGNYSQQLNSINRAREHMQTFLDTAKDLDGGNVKAFNALGNMFSVEFGSDKVGNLNIAKQAFSSEVGKAFAGASVGVTDRQELDHQINAASSFQQLAGAAKTADRLLAGAQKALKETYESGKQGKPNFGSDNQGGGSFTVKAPNGKTYNFKDQASADAFKAKLPQ